MGEGGRREGGEGIRSAMFHLSSLTFLKNWTGKFPKHTLELWAYNEECYGQLVCFTHSFVKFVIYKAELMTPVWLP